MKKILIFNGYYYPSKNCGGPITSIENIVNACSNEFDFYIICYNHDFNVKEPFNVITNKWYKLDKAKVMYVKPNQIDFSLNKNKLILDELKPDLIWFSGVLTPNNKIVTVLNARKLNIPVLFSPRGEVSADRLKLKAYKKIPYLNILKSLNIYSDCYFHGTSEDEIVGIKKYFCPDENHCFQIPNISMLQQHKIINHTKTEGVVKVFFFSRIHEVKNLLFAINCVNKCKYNIEFDIYGPIEDENYWKQCLDAIELAPKNVSIRYCGIIERNNINVTIQSHDLMLFPTFNENYGHVIAECLANSRPIILSKGTTPWDDLNNKAGFVEDIGCEESFVDRLDYFAKINNKDYLDIIENTNKYFLEKTKRDSSISKHIEMFNFIISNAESYGN